MAKIAAVVLLLVACVSFTHGYSASGKNILGPDGKPILLRGIDRPSLEWSATGESVGPSDFQSMAAWGANVVRLCLSQCFWLANTQSYQTTIANHVATIKSLKMGVILDLHWSDMGSTANKCDQQKMPDSRSTTFWTQVATAYKNDPWVIFELYNEPHDVSWAVWRNGGTVDGWTTPGFQSLYNTVRATGANNLVIIGGLNYAYDLSGVAANSITGTNIAYGSHPYDFAGKQPADWPTGFGNTAKTWPVVLTEFGNFNCDPAYYNSIISYTNLNDISWTAWAWYPGGCGFPGLISDYANGGVPTASGQVVKNELKNGKKVPGVVTPTSTATPTTTPTTTKSPATTTTGTVTSGSSSGGTGTKITVWQNQGSGQYWIAIDKFTDATLTTQTVQFKDSSSGAVWVTGVWQSWGAWAWDAQRTIQAPVSLLLTSTTGKQVTLTNVITTVTGAQTYLSQGQYP